MSERASERASEPKKLCTLLSRRQEDGAEFSEFGKEWQQNVVDESKQDTIARTDLEGGRGSDHVANLEMEPDVFERIPIPCSRFC
jgi:hypothetical protein